MKKFLYSILFALATTTLLCAQNPLAKGQTQLNMGIGFSNWGVPVYFGFDHGVHPDITLGAELSFRNYNERWNNNRYDHSIIGISGNANYHFNTIMNISPEWDFYAGLNLGFYHWKSDKDYNGSYTSGLGLGAQIGGRYFFNEKFGINLEFGGGNAFSGGKFGLTIKL